MFERITNLLSDPAALAGTCAALVAAALVGVGLVVAVVAYLARPARSGRRR